MSVARRTGRRPGGPDTKGEILAAARVEFAERAYDGASVRGIAARAGVDPALVHHYFGTKEQLFLAAMEIPFTPSEVAAQIMSGPQPGTGERAVRTFLAIWADPVKRAPFLALLRSAMTHPGAAALLRQFARRAMLARVVARLDVPDRELRAEAAVSHLLGMALMRYVVKIEPLASASEDELVSLVGPVIQRYFDP
ncbi:MAG: TetR/AcrR family transcriptional regulator [Jiangellaceae bacterium]|nr:TetR/AcrR family transcriptional regulator [Jiangellaceae bacterium]